MNLNEIFFWILAIIAVLAGIGVVTARNPVHSVLLLIVAFFSISGHYILLNAQFLAIVNVIVYTGAIMVLFLFVIMLMNLNAETEPQKRNLVKFAGAISGGLLLIILLAAVRKADVGLAVPGHNTIGLIKTLGQVLFSDFVFPFEVSSVLFLSAMVGAIVIGKKDEEKQEAA